MSEQVRKDSIEIKEAGTLTDIFLNACDFLHTKEDVMRLCVSQRILLNGTPVLEDVSLSPSDSLFLLTPQSSEPAVDVKYEIVYEDELLIVVNKPANLPVHPAGKYYFNTLVSLLKQAGKRVYPVNRLDRETSGLVFFATSPFYTRALQVALDDASCIKTYFAVVFGTPSPSEGTITAPLTHASQGDIRDQTIVDVAGKQAITKYKVIESEGDLSLLQVIILTGRRHQIRAHLAHIGHPIVGDKQYGSYPELFLRWYKEPLSSSVIDEVKEKLLATRQLLHCAQLSFIHPQTGKKLLISAEISKDMLLFLNGHNFSSF